VRDGGNLLDAPGAFYGERDITRGGGDHAEARAGGSHDACGAVGTDSQHGFVVPEVEVRGEGARVVGGSRRVGGGQLRAGHRGRHPRRGSHTTEPEQPAARGVAAVPAPGRDGCVCRGGAPASESRQCGDRRRDGHRLCPLGAQARDLPLLRRQLGPLGGDLRLLTGEP
jgi:hypothetical protein